jgi:hypothetical protein
MSLIFQNTNDNFVNYLINNHIIINWYTFSGNTNDIAVNFLIKNPNKIN